MKVLMVLNPALDDYSISGAALQSINLGNELEKKKIAVDYVANDAIIPLINDSSSTVFSVPDLGKRGVIRKTLEYACELYRHGDYDVMHVNIHQMSVLDEIVNVIPDYINVVYTQHTSTILGIFSLKYRESARFLSCNRKNCSIVMPSKYMYNIWKEYTGSDESEMKNVKVAYNGTIDYCKGNLNYQRDNYFVTCSRIDPNKRILELAEFCDSYAIPLKIIGDLGFASMKISDEMKDYYNRFNNLVNTSEFITNISSLPNNEVVKYISRSRGYLTFSKQESFGLTVAEAMSVGTPVFYIQKDSAIAELYDDNLTALAIGDTYRKRKLEKNDMIYNALVKLGFGNKITNDEVDNVRRRYDKLGLSMEKCADRYTNIYGKLVEHDERTKRSFETW